jgi:hypothetical protein
MPQHISFEQDALFCIKSFSAIPLCEAVIEAQAVAVCDECEK